MARITGHLGAVYLGAVKVADTFDWTLETSVNMARASIKGDFWERFIPGRGSGTVTANRFIQTTAVMSSEVADACELGQRLDFDLYGVDGSGGFGHYSGSGYVSRGTIGMPHDGPATDVIEITIDGDVTFA